MRLWLQTLLPPAVTTFLYFIIFGNVIGARLGVMGGVRYIEYIVPGLILMSVIVNSYANVASSFYSVKFHRSIEDILISPVSPSVVVAGFVLGGVARGVCAGFVVLFISLFFVSIPFDYPWIAIIVVVLTAVLFAMGGLINGILANDFNDINVIPIFILTPLTYLGGVFFTIESLPSPWNETAYLNPIFYMMDSFRWGLFGIRELNTVIALSATVFIISILAVTCFYLITRGVSIKK